MSDQSRQLRIEPLEQRIVLGVIVSAGEFFQYLDADGDLQRIYVDAGRIDIDGIEDPGLNDTIDTLTVLDEGTDFDSSAITITEVQANGVANFTAEFGVDVTQGMDTSVGKTGTIDVLQANASGAIITVGTGVVDGNVNTFRMNTGSWSGTLTVEGDITTVDIADDIAVAGQIAADQITTLNVTDDVLGTVETAAGGAITNVTADEVSGTISAGTGVNRGDISSLTLGTVSGGGQIVGEIEGDGTLDFDGTTVTTTAGLDFTVDSTGIAIEETADDVSFDTIEVRLTETGGSTTGVIGLRWTGQVDIYLTGLGTTAGVEVEDTAASAAVVGNIGLDTIAGSLDSIWVDGTFGAIGGAANQNGGGLVSVRDITAVGDTGDVTVSGDLGHLESTGGDVAGTVTVGDELGSIDAFGDLTANVTAHVDTGGDINLLGGTVGQLAITEQAGGLSGTITLAAGSLDVELNDGGDVDTLGVLPGGIDIDLSGLSADAALTSDISLDSVTSGNDFASLTTTAGADVGLLELTAGNLSAAVVVDGSLTTLDLSGDLSAGGSVLADSLTTATVGGNLAGDIDTRAGGALTTLTVTGDLNGTVEAGTAGDRGAMSTINFGSISGAARIDGAIDGDGTLALNGTNVTASSGDVFYVTTGGVFFENQALGGITVGDTTVILTETAGATLGYFKVEFDNSIGVLLTQLGTNAGVDVNNAGGTAVINYVGIDTLTGDLVDIDVEGELTTLGGAANTGGGQIRDVTTLTVDGDLTDATITGNATTWTIGNDVLGTVAIGGSLGTMTVANDMTGSITSGGAVTTLNIGGDLGDAAGDVVQATSFGDVDVGGNAIGVLRATTGDITDLAVVGNVSGTVEAQAGNIGAADIDGSLSGTFSSNGTITTLDVAVDMTGTVTAGGAVGILLIGNDMTGGITAGGAITTLDIGGDLGDAAGDVVQATSFGDVDVGGNAIGVLRATTGDITDLAVVGNVSGTVEAQAGNIGAADIDGSLSGTFSSNGTITTLDVAVDMTGTVTAGGAVGTLLIGNDMTGGITAGGAVTTLNIGGDLGDAAGDVVQATSFGDVDVGGALVGVLRATTGDITDLAVVGNVSGTVEAQAGNIGAVDIDGSLSGGLSSAGTITTLDVAIDLPGTVTAGGAITTVAVGGDLDGSVTTAAGESIGTVTVTGDISGTLRAGTVGDRGALTSASYNAITGAGVVEGAIAGGGTFGWDGIDVTGTAGDTFTVDSTGITVDSTANDVAIGDVQMATGETGGSTTARYFATTGAGAIDIFITNLGTDATLSVVDGGAANNADIRSIGLDTATGALASLSVEGDLTTLGGAANQNGGDLTGVTNLTVAGDVTTATISGDLDGAWQSTGGSFTTVNVGGELSGTLQAQTNIQTVTAASTSGTIQTTAGDIGGVTTTTGDLGGTVAAGDEIGYLEAAGDLTAEVTGQLDAAGNIAALGQTNGQIRILEQGGTVDGTITLSAGSADLHLNDGGDADVLPTMTGGIDIDLTNVSAAADLDSNISIDRIVTGAAVADVDLTGTAALGRFEQTAGDFTGDLTVAGRIYEIEIAGDVSGTMLAGTVGARQGIGLVNFNSVTAAGSIQGAIEADGDLSLKGTEVTATPGTFFTLTNDTVYFDPSGGEVRYGDLLVTFGQSAGQTLGAIATPFDLSAVSVLVTQLGTDATVDVDYLGAGTLTLDAFGFQNVAGTLAGLNIEGNLATLGGAANVGTGDIVGITTLRLAGDLTTATISGNLDGAWTSDGGSFTTVTIGGNLTGTLLAQDNIATVTADAMSGTVRTTAGDIGSITTTVGDLGGRVDSGDELGSLTAEGDLTAYVTATINSAGNVNAVGGTVGQVDLSEQSGAVTGTVAVTGSASLSLNNTTDTDYAAGMAGGIDIDLAGVSAGATVASGMTLDEVTAAADIVSITVTGGNLGRYNQTAGNFSGAIDSDGSIGRIDLAGDLSAGGSIHADTTLTTLNVGGSVAATATVDSGGAMTTVTIGGDLDGSVTTAAGQAIGTVSVTGDVGGTLRAGTVGVRGALTSVDYNAVTGAGVVEGAIDGGGTFGWDGIDVTGTTGDTFTVDSTGITVDPTANDVAIGDVQMAVGETGGSTKARYFATTGAGAIDIHVTELGTNATVSVVDGAAGDNADIHNLGFDTVNGDLASVSVEGHVTTLGGAANVNGGSITNVGSVTLAEGAGTITLAGDLTGDLTSGDAITTLNVGDDVTGNITVSGALTTLNVGGDLGDAAGDVVQATNFGDVDVGGALIGVLRATTGDITDLAVVGNVSGTVEAQAGNIGAADIDGSLSGTLSSNGTITTLDVAVDMTGTVAAGGAVTTLLVGNDMTGSITAGGDIGTLDIGGDLGDGAGDVVQATEFGDVDVGGALIGVLRATTGDITDLAVVGNVSGTVEAQAGNIGAADIDGSLSGTFSSDGTITTLDVANDMSGTVTAGGAVTTLLVGNDTTGSITAGGDIGTLDIGGDLGDGAGDVVQATEFGDVDVGGALIGVLRATTGDITDLAVVGNVSGTVEAQAGNIGTADIGGSVSGDVSSNGTITLLDIGGDVSGTVTSGGNAMVVTIDGDMTGGVTIGGASTVLNIGGDLGDGAGDTVQATSFADVNIGGSLIGVLRGTTGGIADVAVTSNISGTIEALAGSLGDIASTAGSLSGTLSAAQNIDSVVADSILGAALIEALAGDIGSVETDTGNLAGTITAADEIGRVVAAGQLTAKVTGDVDAAGNLAALGETSGRLIYGEGGAETGRVTATAGWARVALNDDGDVDVLGAPAGGIDIDLTINDVAAAIATTVSLDRLTAATDFVSLTVNGDFGRGDLAANLTGTLTVTGDGTTLNLTGQDAASTIDFGGSLDTLDSTGSLAGTINVGGPMTTLHTTGDLSGAADVDGAIGTVDVDGSVTGSLTATGAVTTLDIDGDLGDAAGDVVEAASFGDVDVGGVLIGVLRATTGDIADLAVVGNVSGTVEAQAGNIGAADIDGSLSGTLSSNGTITTLDVANDMTGTVTAGGAVTTLLVGNDMTGNITAGGAITTLDIGGDLGDAVGDVVEATSFGDVDVGGALIGVLRATTGDITDLAVVGNVSGTVEAQAGDVGVIDIGGSLSGTLSSNGTITTLDIANDMTGTVTAGGAVTTLLVGNDMTGSITAGGAITTLDIGGNLGDAAGDVVQATSFGDVDVGGALVGVLRATTGDIADLAVVGNVSGTVEAQAGSIGVVDIDGSLSGTLSSNGTITTLDVANDMTGTVTSGGALTTMNVGGNLSGDVAAGGAMTTLWVGGNLSGDVDIAGPLTTLDIDGDVSAGGTVDTAAGQGITTVDIGGLLDGNVSAGTAANRGAISSVSYGTAGNGEVAGEFDGDGTLQINGGDWTTAAGIDFEVADDELRLESMANLVYGDFNVNLLETGGETMARMWIALDASYISVMVTQVGTDPGIEVVWAGAGSTLVNEIGFDGVTGGLVSVTIDGSLNNLGGASNLNGGSITNVGTLTVSEDILGTVSIGGTLGELDVAGDVGSIRAGGAGHLNIGGNLTGGLVVGGSVIRLDVDGNVTGAVRAGSMQTMLVGGNLTGGLAVSGRLTSLDVRGDVRSGMISAGSADEITVRGELSSSVDVAGNLYELHAGGLSSTSFEAGSIHLLSVAGCLTGHVSTASGGSIDMIVVGGTLGGSVEAGGSAWSTRGTISSIQVGGISGYITGKFDGTGILLLNGQGRTMQPGMPFRYDGRLWPEWLPYEAVSGRAVSGSSAAEMFGGYLSDVDLATAVSSAVRHGAWSSVAPSHFEPLAIEPLPLYNPQYHGTYSLDGGETSQRDPLAYDMEPGDNEVQDDPTATELVDRLLDLSADPVGTASGLTLRRFWEHLRRAISRDDRDLAEAMDEMVSDAARLMGNDPLVDEVFQMATMDGPAEGDEAPSEEPSPASEPLEEAPSKL